jgi:hypothetical protein
MGGIVLAAMVVDDEARVEDSSSMLSLQRCLKMQGLDDTEIVISLVVAHRQLTSLSWRIYALDEI